MTIDVLAADVIAALKYKNMTLATAESCTGGGVGHILTSVPGSSCVYLGGVISYANSAKQDILGVTADTLSNWGAVSAQTAEQMAKGVRRLLGADVAVAITGIAGPASDDTNKPVGLVYICAASQEGVTVKENHFSGSREEVREQSIFAALKMILGLCK